MESIWVMRLERSEDTLHFIMGAGKINKPKACRTNNRTLKRLKVKSHKKPHSRSEETLQNTTEDKLRQCRTNPRANVKLSGKKKRLLLKEAKRLVAEKEKMEVTSDVKPNQTGLSKVQASEKMDTV